MIMKVDDGEYSPTDEYSEPPVSIVNSQFQTVNVLMGGSDRLTRGSGSVSQRRGSRYSFPANMAPVKTIAATIPTSMVVADGPPSDRGV